MNLEGLREYLTRKLIAQRPAMTTAASYYAGTQPLSFLDPTIAKAMQGRLRSLNVNVARLAIDVLAQRLIVVGFASSPDDLADQALWDLWQASDMDTQSELAHVAALVHGRVYYLAWVGPDGQPRITAEAPTQCCVTRDPVTSAITGAIKRWVDGEGYSRTLLFTADEVVEYASRAITSPDPLLPTDMLPLTGEDMLEVRRERNPLGVVPMVALVNRPRLQLLDGESELTDLYPLNDALNKACTDLMTAMERMAIPNRYVTGLFPDQRLLPDQIADVQAAVREDWEDVRASKFLIAPDPRTEFGQFDAAELTNFRTAITLLIEQIAALTALPPYYLSLNTANPTSADAIRASETRLTAKAEQRQRQWSGPYEDLMRLVVLIRDGRPDPRLVNLETQWKSAAPATLAQTADAEAKLVGAGIVDRRSALAALGYSPLEIERITTTEGATA